jgi:CHAD domain-containing protein
MQRELELRVALSGADVQRLGGALPLEDLGRLSANKRVTTVYFDTRDHALREKGLSLRLRRSNGRWLQTAKAEARDAGPSSHCECSVASDRPDLDRIGDDRIKRAVRDAAKSDALHAVFEAIIQPAKRAGTAKGGAKGGKGGASASDDVGTEAGSPWRAAELTVRAKRAEGLLLAAETLLAGQEIRLPSRTLSALDKWEASTAPEKARPARITRDDSCADAFTSILASAMRQILVNRRVVLSSEDPEGAHQLRIGLTRLRSALRSLRPLVHRGSLRTFEQAAGAVARCVGTLRDADVLISAIEAPMEAVASDKTGFGELRDALVRHQLAKRDEVRRALCGQAWTRLQLYLALWPETLQDACGHDRPIARHARAMLRKAWRKPAKFGRHLERLDAEHRHEMRKALKRLRYQAEFFAPLFKERDTRAFVQQLKALQDLFGYLNDARMAPQLLEVQQQQHAGIGAVRAASYALGRHEAEAAHVWRGADKLWKELRRSRRFWT